MRPVHPAAELFPLLEGDEFNALVADVKKNGLLVPVWLYDDPERGEVLLDGRNRWRACEAAGVKITAKKYEGDDPIGFSISQNAKRRHLTTGQRAAVGAAARPLYAAEKEKAKAHGQTAPGRPKEPTLGADLHQASEPKKRAPRATDLAAAAAGTSGRAVAQYERVEREAPDLAEKVKTGEMALDRAERVIRDREAQQRKVEQAKREAESQPEPTTVDIRHGDFREVLAGLKDVDAIITDPPYPAEFLPLLDDLAAWADKVLTEDGVMAVLIGHIYLPEVFRRLDGHRPYRWTACYLMPGAGYVAHARKVQTNWKPLLVYGGGPRFADVIRSEGVNADAKQHHKWGQDYSAFHTIVERLTERGQTVVDPFMGSGTTLLAAHALGRHAIGADIDLEHVATARGRLS